MLITSRDLKYWGGPWPPLTPASYACVVENLAEKVDEHPQISVVKAIHDLIFVPGNPTNSVANLHYRTM